MLLCTQKANNDLYLYNLRIRACTGSCNVVLCYGGFPSFASCNLPSASCNLVQAALKWFPGTGLCREVLLSSINVGMLGSLFTWGAVARPKNLGLQSVSEAPDPGTCIACL